MRKLLTLVLLFASLTSYGQWTKKQLYDKIDAFSSYKVDFMKSLSDSLVKSMQLQLVSGTNIKTLESTSLLGSGNIDLAKGDVGLGNVDNTSDANKPVSTAQQTAIDAKVSDALTDGVTSIAPSQNVVYDAVDSLTSIGKAVISSEAATNIYSFGTSITAGSTGPTGAAYRFPNILNGALGTTVQNQGIAASGAYDGVKAAFALTSLRFYPATIEFGLNDARLGGGTAPTYEKVKGAIRAFLANHFLSGTVVPANSGSVTQGGTWTTVTSGTIGEKAPNISGLALQSAVNGSTLTYTSSGTTLVVGTFGVYEAVQPGGTFTVTVDGVLKATFNNRNLTDGVATALGSQNNITQNAVVITGLPTGSHTVVITITSLSASGKVYIDYIGTLNNRQNCLPVIVMSVPKMDATGYATAPANATDAILNTMDTHAKAVIREFRGFPAYFGNTNLNFVSTTDLHSDHIHRNDLGNSKIARALLQSIQPINTSKAPFYTMGYSASSPFNLYVGHNGGSVSYIGSNRQSVTGVFDNTALPAAAYHQVLASGDASHEFYTSPTNNATPLLRAKIDKDGVLILNRGSVAGGVVRLLEASGSGTNYTEITVAAQAANITLTLPPAVPTVSGQSLVATTAGVMSWAAAAIDATAGDAATINALAGRFRKDTSGTTFTLTNSFITANSIITLTIGTVGITTGYDLAVVPGAGSAVITFQTAGVAAAPSANCDVNFHVLN